MIAVILGTNRPNSLSKVVSQTILRLLKESGEEVRLIDLAEMPSDVLHPNMYDGEQQHQYLSDLQDEVLVRANKWWIIAPEYNGSYPGILKLFLDALSVRRYPELFDGSKKLALTGTASGRGGNLRGLDHLTTAMNYLKFAVLPNRLPLSSLNEHIDDSRQLSEAYEELLKQQVEQFILF